MFLVDGGMRWKTHLQPILFKRHSWSLYLLFCNTGTFSPPSFFSSSSITKFWSVYGSAVEVDEELADCSQRGRYAHPSILALSRTPSVQPIGQVNKPISHFFFAQPQCFLYLYKFVRCHFLRVRSVLPWIHCEIFYLFFVEFCQDI